MYKILTAILLSSTLLSQIKVGDKAPTFFAHTLDNNYFFLSDTLTKHKPIVLSFFATWCGPCRLEMPILDTLSQNYKDIDFYLVNVGGLKGKEKQESTKVKKLLEDLGISLPVLMDKYAKIVEEYGGPVLPKVVIIDQQGKIAYIKEGYAEGDELVIEKKLNELLSAKN